MTLGKGRTDKPWTVIGAGIAVAGGAYPLVVAVPAMLLLLAETASIHDALQAVMQVASVVVVSCGLAIVATALLSVPVLGIVWAFVRLLGIRLSWTALGALGGSAVGFAYFAPICYLGLKDLQWQLGGMAQPVEWVWLCVAATIGPMLAIFLGQVGGAYGGVGVEQQRRALGLPDNAQGEGRVAFSIRQLLGLTVVVSLLLAALRLAGLLDSAMFFLVGWWLVWHVVSRRPAIALARRLRRNRPGGGLLTMPATPTSGAPEPPRAGGP